MKGIVFILLLMGIWFGMFSLTGNAILWLQAAPGSTSGHI